MSRFRKALAATVMAVAAAGGGLLVAAAGAAPAYASAPAAPAPPPGGNTVTITAHSAAPAASGMSPHVILPCAVKPGATPADSCGQQTISCSITANAPFLSTVAGSVDATAIVDCSSSVTTINLQETLLKNGVSVATDSDIEQNKPGAATLVGAACQAGTYANTASASITFPPGYVLTGGTNPIHQTSASIQVVTSSCHSGDGGGGGGGGGGCAITSPSVPAQLAGRHPDLIACP